VLVAGDPVCDQVADQCATSPSTDAAGRPLSTVARLELRGGVWTVTGVDCAVAPAGAAPAQVTAAMARAQAQRLVPHPAIGTAPPGGTSLVNIQTITWLATPADRTLPTVRLLGRQVQLRVHLARVAWDFGDQQQATSTGPGRAYTRTDPCTTQQCPGYFGHTYTRTGTVTITARVTWTGRYRVDAGPWQAIPGTVTAPAAAATLTLRQARAILVPPPTP
jgi:hypothetical protein